jgi:taurine dioxygenase
MDPLTEEFTMKGPAAISVERLTGNIGAVLGGLDLRKPQTAENVSAIRQALLDHGVIFFRDQNLSPEQFWSFMEEFGVPQKEEMTGQYSDTAGDLTTTELSQTRRSTAVWHADTTSLAKPPIVTALRAVEVPPFGGDTCWSSMHAAWDALSEPMRRMLDGLTAVHTIDLIFEHMEGEYAPVFNEIYNSRNARQQIHPVVLTHPETGRKALYVSECFTARIIELDRLESRSVLDFLFRHVERPDFIVRWKWAANDLVLWDNRAVQHYAVPDYATTRRMQRIVLGGVKPGEDSRLRPRASRRPARVA